METHGELFDELIWDSTICEALLPLFLLVNTC